MPLAGAPRLAAISYVRGFDIDRLLVTVCRRLSINGVRLGGLLQISTGAKGGCASTVHVVDLRSNTAFDIWDERGPCAKGCRLDEGGLAEAALVVEQAIVDRVDLLIINRFGRAESFGRGLSTCFASALSVDIPVLTAVRAPYDQAWSNFHGGLGLMLPTDEAAVVSWAKEIVARPEPARIAV